MKNITKTNKLAFSSLMAALAVILFLFTNVPVLQIVGTLICPIPLILVGIKHGYKFLFLSSIASVFIVFLILGPIQAYFYFSIFVSVAAILGIAFYKNIDASKTIIIGTLAMMILNIFFYYGVEKTLGLEDFLKEFSKMSEKYVPKATNILFFYYDDAKKAIINKLFIEAVKKLIRVPLFLFTLVSFSMIYVDYMMCLIIFPKFSIQIPVFKPVFLWKAPWWFLILFFLVKSFRLYPSLNPTPFTDDVYFNFEALFMTAYFIFGLGLTKFFMIKFRIPVITQVIIVLLAYYFAFYTALLGIVDSLLDFRNLQKINDSKRRHT